MTNYHKLRTKMKHVASGRLMASGRFRSVLTVAAFATIGLVAVNVIHASTFATSGEAELGTLSGNVKHTNDLSASAGDSLLFGATTITVPPPPPPPDNPLPNPEVTGPITNPLSGKCLDVENGVASSASSIRIWPCNGGTAQNWTVAFQNDGTSIIKAVGMCLANRDTNGVAVQYLYVELETCSGWSKQGWLPNKSNSRILNPTTSTLNKQQICLDLNGSNPDAGTAVGVYTCLDNPAQQWNLPPSAPHSDHGFVHFAADKTKCLDLPQGVTTPGSSLQVWDCNNQSPQDFESNNDGAGRQKITIFGKCIGAKNNGTADGTPVDIEVCTNATGQNWQIIGATGGIIKNMKSNKCLATADSTVANSVLMVLKTCSTTDPSQQFSD